MKAKKERGRRKYARGGGGGGGEKGEGGGGRGGEDLISITISCAAPVHDFSIKTCIIPLLEQFVQWFSTRGSRKIFQVGRKRIRARRVVQSGSRSSSDGLKVVRKKKVENLCSSCSNRRSTRQTIWEKRAHKKKSNCDFSYLEKKNTAHTLQGSSLLCPPPSPSNIATSASNPACSPGGGVR